MTPAGVNQLKLDEGYRGLPYICPTGHLTIGYGRNLEANPITETEAEYLLNIDILKLEEYASHLDWFQELCDPRRDVVINMMYNLGIDGFLKFKNMIEAIKAADYHKAADEMLDSLWSKQVKSRSKRLADIMRHG